MLYNDNLGHNKITESLSLASLWNMLVEGFSYSVLNIIIILNNHLAK